MVEYTGLNVHAALDLPCDLYLLFYKNWYIDRLSQTEEGRQYLDDCKRLKQTRLDKKALEKLRRMVGGGSGGKP